MLNYWRPGNGFFVGDCMPFVHNGIFHLYYLLDQGHHNHPVVGKAGGHQWAHASSRDLINWTHHPLALPLDFELGETSNCTGSLIEKNDRFFAFYALRASFLNEERLRYAVSDDNGVTFKKMPPEKWELPGSNFGPDFRDPELFLDDNGYYHLLVASRCRNKTLGNGVLLHAQSQDMQHWSKYEPLLFTQTVPECPNLFRWGKFYYLLFGQNVTTHYRVATNLKGPWEHPKHDVIGCPSCKVMKSAAWKDGRRIAVGWLSTYEKGTSYFGGRTIFRELHQNQDGSLNTGFVPEFLFSGPRETIPDIELNCQDGFNYHNIGNVPANFEISCNVSYSKPASEFCFILYKENKNEKGRSINFFPEQKKVMIDSMREIYQVGFEPEGTPLRIIKHGPVIDVEINKSNTVVFANEDDLTSFITCYADSGNVNFRNIEIIYK